MKINPSAYNIGKTGSLRPAEMDGALKSQSDSLALSKNEQNTDKILISQEGARQSDVEQLTKSIVSQMEQPSSVEKLDSIAKAVQEKNYFVPTDELTDRIMQRWIGL